MRVALIAILFLVAFASCSRIVDTKEADSRQTLAVLKAALDRFRADHGRYPSEVEGLKILVDTSPAGRYLKDNLALVDSWGHEVMYRHRDSADDTVLVYSLGPNGVDDNGAGDDIK